MESDAARGSVLVVSGADLMDGTPILDIKPYAPYADAHPDATGSFASTRPETFPVDCPPEELAKLPEAKREALLGVLAQDPRPRYQHDASRVYGMDFAGFNVKFRVAGGSPQSNGIKAKTAAPRHGAAVFFKYSPGQKTPDRERWRARR